MPLDKAVAILGALLALFAASAGVSYSVGPVSAASLVSLLGPQHRAVQVSSTVGILDQGWGPGHMHFTGKWQAIADGRGGRRFAARSSHAGDGVTAEVAGTRVRLYGMIGPDGGKAIVLIDDGQRAPVDFYAPRARGGALVYASPQLPSAVHAVDVVVLGARGPRARGSYVSVEAIESLR